MMKKQVQQNYKMYEKKSHEKDNKQYYLLVLRYV